MQVVSIASVVNIISAVAREMLAAFLLNYKFIPVYVVIVLLIKTQYEKYMSFKSNITGIPGKTVREMVEEAIFLGLVSGFLSSFVLVGAGVVLNSGLFNYLYIIMAVLLLINVRYACISYAGGILAIAVLIFKIPEFDISSLLALIAVMHIVESLLVHFNAARESIPVFISHKGSITGAFLTRKFWPVPVVFLSTLAQGVQRNLFNASSGGSWPLFRPEAFHNGVLALGLDCAIAVLCYTDLAITRQPERKSRDAAYCLFFFGIILFLAAIISQNIFIFKVIGAVFSIAGHEGIALYGRYIENKGTPIFKPVRRGLKVLDILPGSHAERMGMQKGDVILNINGKDIQTEEGMIEALKVYPSFVWIHVTTAAGQDKTYEYKCYPEGLSSLGILPVPREKEVTYNIDYYENLGIIKNLVARFRGFNRPL